MLPIREYFKNNPAQEKVAKFLLETGLSVKNGDIYCNGVKMSPARIGRTLDIDRRTVNKAIETIEKNEELNRIFQNLEATAFYGDVAPKIDAGMIEIIPDDPHGVGILAGVSEIIAELGLSIRQSITEDPEFTEEARLFVITESKVPMEAVEKINQVEGVKSVTIY